MNKLALLFLSSIILFNTANAQMGGGGRRPEPQMPNVDEESLIFLPPADWTPYGKEGETKTDTYAFPEDQEPSDWKQAIHYEQYKGTQGVTESREVYELRTKADHSHCAEFDVTLIKQEPENGYSMIEWLETCTATDESIMQTLNKVILGNEKLFSVSKAWKYAPEEDEMGVWLNYMDQVYVCDPNTGVNECRPLNPPPGRRGRR